MVNKSLILAFTAAATAAPQFDALGALGGLSGLKPSSKAKTASSGKTIPDGLNYNEPLDDDNDQDWSSWEYNEEEHYNENDPEESGTLGSTVVGESDPQQNTTTTVALKVTSSTSVTHVQFPSNAAHRNTSTTITFHRDVTTSSTLRLLGSMSSSTRTSTTLRKLQSTTSPTYDDRPTSVQ
jgi:hypothetical protein